MKISWKRWSVALVVGALCSTSAVGVDAQTLLLRDDFDGTGNVDTTVWRLPFGSEGTFVGRTQYRGDSSTDMPQQGILEPLATDEKVTEIHLDTYSPIDPGNQFLGTDLLTKRNFALAGGLTFEARLRLKPPTTGGLVNGVFLFDVVREDPPGTPLRDEIDWELISNQAVGPASQDPYSNYWNDGSFSSGGDGKFHDVPGLDLTQFQNYKVEWTPQAMKWYVNDSLVRTQTTNVPDDPMKLHLNLWAPDSGFEDAFNAALQPTATEQDGETYSAQVDYVEVNRINTTAGANLLTNPSFENSPAEDPVFIGSVPATTTNQWLKFGGENGNNVSIEFDDPTGLDPFIPDMAADGELMAKAFGPFSGGPDASGLVQNVVAEAGQQFEASVQAQTTSGDSISGTENYNTVQISFLDEDGAVIEDAPFVSTNGNDFPLLDGRDPNMPEDAWVEGVVDAIAPEGTVYARISLFFTQPNNEGGASWFDDASLVLLTPDELPGLTGDYNGSGQVEQGDLDLVLLNWGGPSDPAPNGWVNDLPKPDIIDQEELDGVLLNWGASTSAAAGVVPEPSSLLLLVLAGLGLCRNVVVALRRDVLVACLPSE